MAFSWLARAAAVPLVVVPALAAAAHRAAAPPTVEPPRAIVREAMRAVEGDSVDRVRARWDARFRTTPTDRAAALGLATIARLTYDYAGAAQRYSALAAGPPGDAVATYALLGAATASYANGFTPKSDSLFVRALAGARAANDSAAEAEALAGLAMDRGPALGAPVGLALLDSAHRLAPRTDEVLDADIGVRRTIFMAVLSNPGAAAEGARARDLAHRAGDRRIEALALRALALDLHLRAQDDSAVRDLAEAERLERAAHDRATLAETLIRHADIYHGRGDIGLFRSLLEQAATEAEASHNLYALASARVALGVVGLSVGDFDAARANFDDAARRYAEQGDAAIEIAHIFQANLALATGDLATARTLATEVRAFHHRVSDASEEFEALRTLTAIERRAGRYDAALAWLDTAAALARHRDRTWARNLSRDAAAVEFARGNYARAATLLTAYVATVDTADHVPRHAARELLAASAARSGDYARAEAELSAAENELDAWRATLSDRALRTLAFQVRGSDVDVEGSAAPLVIAALATHGRAPAAFELAERRRARVLADRLVRGRALAARESDSTAATTPPTQTSAAAAARIVDERTALIEYVTGAAGAPTTLFVVSRGAGAALAVRAFALPSADSLAPLVARLTALLEAGSSAGRLPESLGTVLLPALATLGSRVDHLVIVADGPLHRLPFDALRASDGRYVVERYTVSVAPSAVVAAELRGRVSTAPARSARILAFGDPAFANGAPSTGVARQDESAAFRSAFDATGGLPRLAASGDEARAVARYAPNSVVRVGGAATATYLKHTPLASFDVIHFATHALVDERSVSRTALALAPGDGESGFVSPGDLSELRLDAGLVVLSACRSAGGVVVDGEGVQGLTAPLLEAGAKSVVATDWRIGDRATVAFIRDFYASLASRLPVADALRAAKVAAMRRGAPPSEWAAFVVVGDPTVRLPLRSTRRALAVGARAARSARGCGARRSQLAFTSSTRRFFARPSGVSFGAAGFVAP